MNIIHFLLIIIQFIVNSCCLDTLGPVSIEIENIEECDNPSIYKEPFNLSMTKVNRTHTGISGRYNIEHILDSAYRINVTLSKWGDGGWKPNAFDFVSYDPCNALMKYSKKLWTAIQRAVRVEEKCPMPSGIYASENYVAPLENIFPSMLYGKFRSESILDYKGELILCMRHYINAVRPKGYIL